MRMPSRLLLAATLLCAVTMTGPAGAQVETREGIALQNQIAELRQELQIMQQNQQSGGQAPSNLAPPPYQGQYQPSGAPGAGGDTAAETVVRLSALEEQTRTLQGRVDDLTNQLQHMHDDLAKQIGDLAFKAGQAPAGPAAAPDDGPGPSAALPAETRPAAPSARRTPELALREGNAALARRDYVAAAAAAREALAGHSPRATDAQFLLARAEAGQHEYKQAAADFYQAYNHAPRAATAPIALLGVANTLIALNDNRDACQALAKLTVEFPGAAKAGVAGARKRAACGR